MGLSGGARQPEADTVVGPAGSVELGVAGELGRHPGERLAAGVVLQEEPDPLATLLVDAGGVGAHEGAVQLGAAPLGAPRDEGGAGLVASGLGEGAEEAVHPEEVGEAGAGGEAQRPASQLGGSGGVDAATRRVDGGTGGPEGVVPGFGADEGMPAEPVHHPEADESEQAPLGEIEAAEAQLGELGGGEDLVLGQDRDDEAVPCGEGADDAERVRAEP